MENKRVLFLGGNFFPEPTGIGKYNGEMVDWMSENGFECTVITTFPYYPYWKVQAPYTKRCWGFVNEKRVVSADAVPVNIIRAPHYVPAKPTGMKRMVSDFSFFISAFIVMLGLLFQKKHDYVVTVAPPFQLGLLAILYKMLTRAKFIYHIQDLQIDAARDLNLIKSPLILKILFATESFILKNADHVSTISEGMIKKVKAKCNKEIVYFPNWVDTVNFRLLNDKEELKKLFGFAPTDKVILYSGAIGEKQGLEAILHCAKNFINEANIKFVICGSGPYKEKLESLKDNMGLKNVFFSPLQPLEKFNAFLNMADVHLLLQKENASDLVMPSKLTTILAIGGLSIVTAKKGTSLHEVVSTSNLGILIDPENQTALNNAIQKAISINGTVFSKNARHYAESNLSINQVLNRYSSKVFTPKYYQLKPSIKNMAELTA